MNKKTKTEKVWNATQRQGLGTRLRRALAWFHWRREKSLEKLIDDITRSIRSCELIKEEKLRDQTP